MLNCHQVTRMISESRERPLTLKEKMDLKIHLVMCQGCRYFEKNARTIRKAMQKFSTGTHEKRGDDR